jgi:diadenosine tetraphosphate (Ap4A) HIT family hydrolase
VDDIVGCFACDLSHGRVHLPGGSIHRTDHWVVEHCAGPLGVVTLIVKPSRHLVHVSDLTQSEATEMGPLLRRASSVVMELARPEQVYVCLWSHGPVHIHFVIQPVDSTVMAEFAAHGPKLQVACSRPRRLRMRRRSRHSQMPRGQAFRRS